MKRLPLLLALPFMGCLEIPTAPSKASPPMCGVTVDCTPEPVGPGNDAPPAPWGDAIVCRPVLVTPTITICCHAADPEDPAHSAPQCAVPK